MNPANIETCTVWILCVSVKISIYMHINPITFFWYFFRLALGKYSVYIKYQCSTFFPVKSCRSEKLVVQQAGVYSSTELCDNDVTSFFIRICQPSRPSWWSIEMDWIRRTMLLWFTGKGSTPIPGIVPWLQTQANSLCVYGTSSSTDSKKFQPPHQHRKRLHGRHTANGS